MQNPTLYGYTLLTLLCFIIGLKLSKRLKSSILNPFILAFLLLVAIILTLDIPFAHYYQGNAPLNSLLGVSVVALAVPFYERLPQIRRQWKPISLIVLLATLFSMLSGLLLAILVERDPQILAAVLPKSVTTAIAVSIADEIGGSPALSAIGVIIAGLTGSAFGSAILRISRVKNPMAVGLSIGAASHALGTARLAATNLQAAGYASVALVLCGTLSALLAPLVFKLTLWLL